MADAVAGQDFLRSPLENVLNFVTSSQGHEKALKYALYNAVGLSFVIFALGVLASVYFVLNPFLRPLLWAVLFGSVLHPFKQSLARIGRQWLQRLKTNRTPIALGVVMLPVSIVEHVAEATSAMVYQHYMSMTSVTCVLGVFYLLSTLSLESYLSIFDVGKISVFGYTHNVISYFNTFWVWSVVVGYLLVVIFYWSPETSGWLTGISWLVWMLVLFYIGSVLGPYRIPVVVFALILMVVGFIRELKEVYSNFRDTSDDDAFFSNILNTFWYLFSGRSAPPSVISAVSKQKAELVPPEEEESSDTPPETTNSNITKRSVSPTLSEPLKSSDTTSHVLKKSAATPSTAQHSTKAVTVASPATSMSHSKDRKGSLPIMGQRSFRSPLFRQQSYCLLKAGFLNQSPISSTASAMSNIYIFAVLWACLLVQIWLNVWIWPLIALPGLYIIFKRLGSHFGVWIFLTRKFHVRVQPLKAWLLERRDALLPAPLRGVFKLLRNGDQKVVLLLEQSIDVLTTIAVFCIVAVVVTLAAVFMLVQIHSESMHLVRVTSNLVNSTILHNPEIQHMLPEGVNTMIDTMFDHAYEYGRDWTVRMVKTFIDEKDEEKALVIEAHVIELWDRVYKAWMIGNSQTRGNEVAEAHLKGDTNSSTTPIADEGGGQSTGGVFSKLAFEIASPGMFNFSDIASFVQDNLGMLMTVLDASWTVLKGNISLAVGALTAAMSVLFGGGTALMNFLISFFVFLTGLFYLLSSSGERYKLIVLVTELTPPGSGNRFGLAVEEAINGVFAASFKMAAFYGLWTWLIHTLFDVRMVYVPSAIAAMFGAMPFLGTYWAVLPAVLELWLIQGQGLKAILMLLCQLLPMSCVDTSIYSEINGGGHPYLTGLAVAGGIFCLGVEGAIIGPILLCSLFVAMHMYGNMLQESPVDESNRRAAAKTFIIKRSHSVWS